MNWINADEKLPELTIFGSQFSEDLLLWHCRDRSPVIGYYDDKSEWRVYEDEEKVCEYISHWMPLPKDPEEA